MGARALYPTTDEIVQAREAAKLTQAEASEIIFYSRKAWQKWETAERKMHPALYELFLFKTNQRKPGTYKIFK